MSTQQQEAQLDEGPAVKPFAAFVQEAGGGVLHDELSTRLAELVQACVDTGKKGALTLKVSCAPQKDEVTMLITTDVAVKVPKQDSKPALFYPDENGNLLRSDPRQMDFSTLREIPGGKTDTPRELKEAK